MRAILVVPYDRQYEGSTLTLDGSIVTFGVARKNGAECFPLTPFSLYLM